MTVRTDDRTTPTAVGTERDRRDAADALDQLAAATGATAEIRVGGTVVRLTSLDKPMYPAVGFTKRDVARYYLQVAPALLAHVRARPLTLKRYPDGVDGQFFYQKRCPEHRPDWVRVSEPIGDQQVRYCLPDDVRTLLWAANLADLELHVLLARARTPERPTAMVFDLDPGEGADIVTCCRVGVLVRELLGELDLEVLAKTSGSKGLQLYVPLNQPRMTYERTKPFAHSVAQLLEARHPDLVVSKQLKTLRTGRVLVDWSQNDDHKTTVAAYSLRAKQSPTASTPVTWAEVGAAIAADNAALLRFTHDQTVARLHEHGDLFAPVLDLRQKLPKLG